MQLLQLRSDFVNTAQRKILVLEDDNSVAEFMQHFLEMFGYSYWIVSGTDNILQLIDEFNPDLIILDYLLPITNGREICAQVKKNKDTSYLPVLIYSAYPGILCSLGDCGFDAFLAKPFELTDMEMIIEKLVGRELH